MKQLVRRLRKYLYILRILFSLSNQKIAEYRGSFFLETITITMWLLANILWVLLVFSFTDIFIGYSIWQYIAFQGFYFFAINLFWFFFDVSLNTLSNNIYDGKIDLWITKPMSAQFLASFNEFHIPSLVNLLYGFAVFICALVKQQIVLSITQVLSVLLIVVLSNIIFYSISFIVYCLTFWVGRLRAIHGILDVIFDDATSIPTDAYKGGLKFLFYFVVPVAITVTIPTSIVFFDFDSKMLLYYFVFAVLVYLLSRIVWRLGLRTYSSVSG